MRSSRMMRVEGSTADETSRQYVLCRHVVCVCSFSMRALVVLVGTPNDVDIRRLIACVSNDFRV